MAKDKQKKQKPKDESEAGSSSSSAPLLRKGVLPPSTSVRKPKASNKKESVRISDSFCGGFRFLETTSADGFKPKDKNRFKVVLIQEGLGNLKDCFYYTKEAIQSAPPVFEGKKVYADHPDALEEQTRPERSVRDVLGHFENCHVEEGIQGQSLLVGDLVLVNGASFDWARDQFVHALEYSAKFPNQDFIGLSINASGDAVTFELDEFLSQNEIPEAAQAKLSMASSQGADEVRAVRQFTEAVSCDLVTEAGAGGKILQMLEMEKQVMKKKIEAEEKKLKESEESEESTEAKDKKEADEKEDGASKADDGDADGDDGAEDDDKALIKKKLKKQLGDESSDDDMKQAEEAFGMMKKDGMNEDEAVKTACAAVKYMKQQKEKEAAEAEAKDDDDASKAKKESSQGSAHDSQLVARLLGENLRLKGRLAKVEEANKKKSIDEYIESTCAKSKLPRSVTKVFKESVVSAKSKTDVDSLFKIFSEGYQARGESDGLTDFTFALEKSEPTISTEGAGSYSDCVID